MASTAVPATATDIQSSTNGQPNQFSHPLDPLSPDEIVAVTLAVRTHVATVTSVKAFKFITCYLLPAPKRVILAHLGIPTTPGGEPELRTTIVRKAEVDFIDVVDGRSYNVLLSLTQDGWVVETLEKLKQELHPQITIQELEDCERIVRADARVQELAKQVGVLPEQIYADGWSIGFDSRFPQHQRILQALLFARLSEHENLYAHPMDFVPVIDANSNTLIHIDFPAHYESTREGGYVISSDDTSPPKLEQNNLRASKRERLSPPMKPFDFLPDLMAQNEGGHNPRRDVKPLHIVQPEGVSFRMNGNELEWQKWKMHISYAHREGIALSTITYNDNGKVRPIIYRLSLAEMVVPYGAPEHPHPRKLAFDVGEYGMGTQANELSLGCDCLGRVHYLPGAYVSHNGSAIVIKNVICIHEEDAGLLWKHTDWRQGGRSHTVRSRRLVISMVCTLANYEYIWNYHFYQDGTIEIEVRLSGILQVYPLRPNEPAPFGTQVAPGINAHNHQHLFSFRIDPMIDGLQNSVIETDIVALPDAPTGSSLNYAGNAFVSRETVLKSQLEGGRSFDFDKDRRWRIVNNARKHYASGQPVGYSIASKGAVTPLASRIDSWLARRAHFTTKALWVVKNKEDQHGGRMWPSGKYVPQTREEPLDSVGQWVKIDENIENEDIVLFITIGTTHIPRPEDWPVMPVEHLRVNLKPVSFFDTNPSMDVPGVKDERSVAAFSN